MAGASPEDKAFFHWSLSQRRPQFLLDLLKTHTQVLPRLKTSVPVVYALKPAVLLPVLDEYKHSQLGQLSPI